MEQTTTAVFFGTPFFVHNKQTSPVRVCTTQQPECFADLFLIPPLSMINTIISLYLPGDWVFINCDYEVILDRPSGPQSV
eukprot:scaffold31334_cov89-Skeletonema_dohrnii-CCMP3373.AAC.2